MFHSVLYIYPYMNICVFTIYINTVITVASTSWLEFTCLIDFILHIEAQSCLHRVSQLMVYVKRLTELSKTRLYESTYLEDDT